MTATAKWLNSIAFFVPPARLSGRLAGALALAVLCATSGGCRQLAARRLVQKADDLYREGNYLAALELYQEALAKSDLTIAHHNAGITALAAFEPGMSYVPNPNGDGAGEMAAKKAWESNERMADLAIDHFRAYLKVHPDQEEIVDLLSGLWVNAERYDDAIDFWTQALTAKPNDEQIIARLAEVNRHGNRHAEALRWSYKLVDLAADDAHKVKRLLEIAAVQKGRLASPELVDDERIAVADTGLAALDQAVALTQEETLATLGARATLYERRAAAHYAQWARAIDVAEQNKYSKAYQALAAIRQPTGDGPMPRDAR